MDDVVVGPPGGGVTLPILSLGGRRDVWEPRHQGRSGDARARHVSLTCALPRKLGFWLPWVLQNSAAPSCLIVATHLPGTLSRGHAPVLVTVAAAAIMRRE